METVLEVANTPVLSALAGARILSPTISAGCHRLCQVRARKGTKRRRTYNHVMPSQPTAKKELKTNSNTALTTCAPLPLTLPSTARSTIVRHCPTAPKSISFRRPTRSIRKMAMREAKKYSVPFAAAMIRDLTSERPRRWNNNV